MKTHLHRGLAWVLLCLLTLSASAAAQRNKGSRRAVVLSFKGWKASAARKEVVKTLGAEFGAGTTTPVELVPESQAIQVARQLGVSLDSAEGRAAVAKELRLDFFVGGEVKRRGAKARTFIRIYDSDGARAGRRQAPSPTANDEVGLNAAELVQDYVSRTEGRQKASTPTRSAAAATVVAPVPTATAASRAAEDPAAKDAAADDDEPADSNEPPSKRLPWFGLQAGVDLQNREAEFVIPNADTRVYDSSLFASIALEGLVRPWAAKRSAVRGFFARFDFAHSVGLTSNSGGGAAPLSTKAWRAFGHVGYGYWFWRDRMELAASLGFGSDVFQIDDNPIIPTSKYLQMPLALSFRSDIVGRLLYAQIFGGYRLLFHDGDLTPRFGSTPSQRFGFDVGGMLGGALRIGFTYGVRFTYTRYSMNFSGPASDVEATSGVDRRLVFTALVGWQY